MRLTKSGTTAVLLAAAVLAGCTEIKANRGYVVDEILVDSVQAGVDNKDSVQKTLGRPTFAAEFDKSEWYYVSRNTDQLAFLAPRPTKQSIIRISFDPKGNVAKVERRGLEQVVDITPSRDKTPTLGRHTSILEDLFGGVGKFGSGATTPESAGGTGSGRDGPK